MIRTVLVVLLALTPLAALAQASFDATPAAAGEWGFRPAEGEVVARTPPAFVWRPQEGAASYQLELWQPGEDRPMRVYTGIWLNCFCPPEPMEPGAYQWSVRAVDANGELSEPSPRIRFSVPEDATEFPMPPISELVDRIPSGHPRLFVTPADLESLLSPATQARREATEEVIDRARALLEDPPDTSEPPLYPPDVERKSPEWKEIWWGNRRRVIAVADGAATLAFAYLATGEQAFGDEAKRLLMATVEWDPTGATGYRYNDEAAMPMLYMASRAYTWCHDRFQPQERKRFADMMRARGEECYSYLRGAQHTWRPYNSHSNRAYHWLGELAIAFIDEIPEAEEWLEFSVSVFFCVYPAWSDPDGGWHEGLSYWASYVGRVTQWLAVMRAALEVDGYEMPYFSQAGYFPMYMAPPHAEDSGFGDLCRTRPATRYSQLMGILASATGNGHWAWYWRETGGQRPSGYLGALLVADEPVEPEPPTDLFLARLFEGTGLASMHTTLLDAREDVSLYFKSSPFGTQSHGFNAENSFILTVLGDPIFIYSGYRDIYGSPHHRDWMWATKSDNSILVNGQGAAKHSRDLGGEIVAFQHSPRLTLVSGEAAEAYQGLLDRFTRTVVFVRPDFFVIVDRLEAPEPSRYQFLLHTDERMIIDEKQAAVRAESERGACTVEFLWPESPEISQTSEFDPPPWDELEQWHLTASTVTPRTEVTLVTVLRPHAAEAGLDEPSSAEVDGDVVEVTVPTGDGMVTVRIEGDGLAKLAPEGEDSEADADRAGIFRRRSRGGVSFEF